MTREELDVHVAGIFATLDGATPALLAAFGAGLCHGDGPAALFGPPLVSLAVDRENRAVPGPLTMILMRRALRLAARDGALAAVLADAQEPFWRAVADAVEAVAFDHRELASSGG